MAGDLNHQYLYGFGGLIVLDTVGIFDTIDVAAAFDVTGRFDIIRVVGVVRDRRNYKNKYLYGIDPYR